MRHVSIVSLGVLVHCLCALSTVAQHHHSGSGYHIDHHDHIVRDRHGHVIGRYHHDVVHEDSRYIVPHDTHYHGTFYSHGDDYYYVPQTSGGHPTARPIEVAYGGFSHVDELARRLEELANELCLDMHHNYSHNRGFRQTYREAFEILTTAQYIHEEEHHNHRDEIRRRLAGLDQLLHHVQEDVSTWTRHQRRQIGHRGILTKLDLAESTLHHLMHDVGVEPGAQREAAPPPSGSATFESAPAPALP